MDNLPSCYFELLCELKQSVYRTGFRYFRFELARLRSGSVSSAEVTLNLYRIMLPVTNDEANDAARHLQYVGSTVPVLHILKQIWSLADWGREFGENSFY